MEEQITISKKEYEKLLERSNWLDCLEVAGVDNWEGISYALELASEEEE